jgi:hypothetical protein
LKTPTPDLNVILPKSAALILTKFNLSREKKGFFFMCLTLNQFKSTLAKPCGGILPLGPCPPVPPSVLFVPFCQEVSLGAAQARGSIQRSPERENYRTKPSCNLQTPASLSSGYLSIQSHSRGFKGIQSYSKLFQAFLKKKGFFLCFQGI